MKKSTVPARLQNGGTRGSPGESSWFMKGLTERRSHPTAQGVPSSWSKAVGLIPATTSQHRGGKPSPATGGCHGKSSCRGPTGAPGRRSRLGDPAVVYCIGVPIDSDSWRVGGHGVAVAHLNFASRNRP